MTAQHPRILLMHLEAADAEVGGGLVAGGLAGLDHALRRGRDRGLAGAPLAHHLLRGRDARRRLHGRELRALDVGAGGRRAEGPDAFRDLVDGERELRVLRLEERVERGEHRAGHVPVEVVRLQVQRVAVGQEPAELLQRLLVRLRVGLRRQRGFLLWAGECPPRQAATRVFSPRFQLTGQSSPVWSASRTRSTSPGLRPVERSLHDAKRITPSGSTRKVARRHTPSRRSRMPRAPERSRRRSASMGKGSSRRSACERRQARCTYSLSVLAPRSCAPRAANSGWRRPNSAISVGQTKVKSLGQKKTTSHFPGWPSCAISRKAPSSALPTTALSRKAGKRSPTVSMSSSFRRSRMASGDRSDQWIFHSSTIVFSYGNP